MKIVHLSTDNFFLINALEQFEECYPNENQVLIWSNKAVEKCANIPNYRSFSFSTNPETILKHIGDAQLVVIHALIVQSAKVVLANKDSNVKFCWMIHGFEAYNTSKFKKEAFLTPKTSALIKYQKWNSKIKAIIRKPTEIFLQTDNKIIIRAAQKVDYFGMSYKEEYDLMKERFSMRAAYLPFCYYPLDKIIINHDLAENIQGTNILIGNSATPSNNHLDVFEHLSTINKPFKAIVPLSYGDSNYGKLICEKGATLLGDSFEPLLEFIPIDQYNEILSSCQICVMFHHRQQAVGTIYAMLFMGSKVYLNEKSSLYKFLQRIGAHVYSVEKDFLTSSDVLDELENDQKQHNRSLIKKHIDRPVLLKTLKEHLDKILVS